MIQSSKVWLAGLFVAFLALCHFVKEEQWVLNQEHQSDFEVSGSKVTFKHEPVDYFTYFNAMYLGLNANDNPKAYWEFECSNGCTVGLAKREAFADGFGIKGAFRGHNKNKIGLILDADEKELKIYIVENGRPLGLAYTQDAPFAKAIHPVVRFTGPGTAEIKEKPVTDIETLLTAQDFPDKGKKFVLIII